MKRVFLVIWITAMCIGLFTNSVEALRLNGKISFHMNPSPSTDLYFPAYSFIQENAFELIGHSLMFAILTYLLFMNVQKLSVIYFMSLFFAIMTELIQPFFGRGADFYDLFADIIGILTVVLFRYTEKILIMHTLSPPEKN